MMYSTTPLDEDQSLTPANSETGIVVGIGAGIGVNAGVGVDIEAGAGSDEDMLGVTIDV